MNRILFSWSFLIGFFTSTIIIAQTSAPTNLKNVYNPIYPSPTAASLGKYSDIPVSYHTGVPSISIPLYTLTEGDLQLPISVSYHAGGIRVDETASAIGLGWSLNAGGMISRTVNGGPDEGMTHSLGLSPKNGWGFYKNGGFPAEINQCANRSWDNYHDAANADCPPSYVNCTPCIYWYHDAALGAIDLEPDLYSFNVNGYSGKFFFDANRNVHFIEASEVFIKPLDLNLTSWLMITPDGAKYYFGTYAGNNATEKSYADPIGVFANFPDLVANTTWYLTRIESPGSERWMTIEYEDEYYCFGSRKGQSYYPATAGGDNPNIADPTVSVTYVQGKRLKRVLTSSEFVTVNFNSSVGGREDLNKSTITRANNLTQNSDAKSITAVEVVGTGFYKKFNFSQDYFNATASVPPPCVGCGNEPIYSATQHKKRLRLLSITETDGTNSLPPHVFLYNGMMPARYSLGRDFQGFYNGADSNDGWIQNGSQIANYSFVYNTGDNRQPSEYNMKAGVLTSVTYPMGRVTSFDYEAHTDGTKLIGGLRIKTITELNDGVNAIVRQFTYDSAKLYYDDNVNYANFVDQDKVVNSNLTIPEGTYLEYNATAPVVPMYSPQGYSIAYNRVTETQAGNGSTIYSYYSFVPVFPPPANRYFPDKPVISQPGSGELKRQEVKNNSNVSLSLKQLTSVNVGTPVAVVGRRVGLATRSNGASPGNPMQGWPHYQDYTITSGRFLTTVQRVTQDGILTQTTNTYDAIPLHNKPRKVEVVDSRGIVKKTEFTYAVDAGSGAPSSMTLAQHSQFKNMLSAVTEERAYDNNVLVAKTTNQYAQEGPYLNVISNKSYPSGSAEFVESQLTYSDAGRVINVTQTNTGIPKGFQWSHNNTLPIAEATNASNTKRTVYTPVTATEPISSSQTTPFTISKTFTVGAFGNVVLSLGRTTNPGSNQVYADYSGTLGTGTLTLTYYTQCGQTAAYFNNVAPGTYTINITLRTTPVNMTMNVCGEIQYPGTPTTSVTGITEFFFEGFEVGSATGTATPHTGKKYLIGDYTTTYTKPNARNYTIEYWYLSSGQWTYATATYNNGMVLTSGDAIDDVRIYPTDARMKSYNYDPVIGLTSVIDENGNSLFYHYDSFGRLSHIKNDKGGIEKQYTYNYKTN